MSADGGASGSESSSPQSEEEPVEDSEAVKQLVTERARIANDANQKQAELKSELAVRCNEFVDGLKQMTDEQIEVGFAFLIVVHGVMFLTGCSFCSELRQSHCCCSRGRSEGVQVAGLCGEIEAGRQQLQLLHQRHVKRDRREASEGY